MPEDALYAAQVRCRGDQAQSIWLGDMAGKRKLAICVRRGSVKKVLSLLLIALLFTAGAGCRRDITLPYIMPVTIVRNNVHITIDPRVELMSTVQYLSDYDELITTATFAYRADVDEYFADFRKHKAVAMYEDMVANGFRYSVPASFALSLTPNLHLDDSVQLSYHVRWGGGGEKKLAEFAAALRDFSLRSNFHDFFVSHEEYYLENINHVATLLEKHDYATELTDYYGIEYASFNILPVPLYGGGAGYGPHVERKDRVDIYSILCAFDEQMSGEVPSYGSINTFKSLQRHEFSHSFVNPTTEMFLDEVMKYEYLLEPIQEEMDKLNYGSWITCLNEHIVRAVNTRLAYSDSRREGNQALARELEAGFIYTKILVNALEEYENYRDKYPDFISFYPKLLEALVNNPS